MSFVNCEYVSNILRRAYNRSSWHEATMRANSGVHQRKSIRKHKATANDVSYLTRVSWLFMLSYRFHRVRGFFLPSCPPSSNLRLVYFTLSSLPLPSLVLSSAALSPPLAQTGIARRDEWVSRFSIIDKMADKSHRIYQMRFLTFPSST